MKKIDDILSRVTHHAFANSGIVQQVLSVYSSEVKVMRNKKNKRIQQLYLDILKHEETVQDIMGDVLRIRP